jgi:PASTA domain-containing protein
MAGRITLYDILGIVPGASTERVRSAYKDKTRHLERAQIADAPPKVIDAAVRGRKALDAAWLILGNPAARGRYDEQIGISHKGAGLARAEPTPSRPGLDALDSDTALGTLAALGGFSMVLAGLGALADWLTPPPRKSRRQTREVIVPDVRGLFSGPCQDVLAKADFRISTVRLTDQPMPVEGLVVDQSPLPGEKVTRFSTLTVQVWHPPRSQ